MRKKNVLISLFIIAILGFLVASSSLAYFTDKDDNSETVFVLGTVDIESVEIQTDELEPFYAERTGKWTIKNTGTKAANLRAKAITNWGTDGDCELGRKETAWAKGTRFTDKGNWAMYFTYNSQGDSSLSVDLIAGQHYKVGTVTITKDIQNEKLKFSIKTNSNWRINDIKLHVGQSLNDFSIGGGGNPQVGNFDYHSGNLDGVSSYSRSIPLSEVGNHDNYYIAVHADVQECSGGGNNGEGAEPKYSTEVTSDGWSKVSDEDGWYYYCSNVLPNEDVEFEVEITLKEPWEEELELSFEGEAVQASNNAIVTEWGIKWEDIEAMCKDEEGKDE